MFQSTNYNNMGSITCHDVVQSTTVSVFAHCNLCQKRHMTSIRAFSYPPLYVQIFIPFSHCSDFADNVQKLLETIYELLLKLYNSQMFEAIQ